MATAPRASHFANRRPDPLEGGDRGESPDLAQQVRDALLHLYDLAYLQTHPLNSLLPFERPTGRTSNPGRTLRQALLDAIEALSPGGAVPSDSSASRPYQLLRLRYVEALDSAEVARRLSIGKSEYHRDLRKGIAALALLLEERFDLSPVEERLGRKRASSMPSQPAAASGSAAAKSDADVATRLNPLPPPKVAVGNLPTPLANLVGRVQELAEVRGLLAEHRLVTLTGTGGSGKTRLALQVARELEAAYPDGAWLVELGGIADPTLVPQAIAAVLGLVEEKGTPIVSKTIDYFRTRRALLVLDNCEHLIEACARLVDALLRACPTLGVLATSREALRTDGETVYLVPLLAVPDPDRLPTLEELLGYGGVQLFVQRAASASHGFRVTAQNAPSVARICSRLDGLPLAIELAAARVRVLSPEQIAQRLDDRFALLTGGIRSALPRQQTLEATLDWSHDLLAEPEKALFRRLAVFSGGWSLQAAEAVCAGRDVDPEQVFDLLAHLVDKSLVVVEPGIGQESRYRLLETISQYARERLEEADEAKEVLARHREWLVDLAERAEPELTGPSSLEWLSRIEREQHNLRAALESSLDADPGMGLRLAESLQTFWQARGQVAEGRRWLEALLAQGPPPTAVQTRGLLTSGDQASGQDGDLAAAARGLEARLELFRELGDSRGVALALLGLGWLTMNSFPSRASAMLGESLELFRELGDNWGIGRALQLLHPMSESPEETAALLQEGLPYQRLAGDQLGVATTLYRLGVMSHARCDFERARALYEESLSLSRQIGHSLGAGWALCDLGSLAMGEGDYGRARALLDESLALGRELKDELGITWRLLYLGHLARIEGRHAEARRLLEECSKLSKESGSNGAYSLSLVSSATLARVEGRYGMAEALFRAGLSSLRATDYSDYVPNCLLLWGLLEVERREHARGVRLIAAGTVHGPDGTFLYNADQTEADAALDAARSALGEEAFTAAWAAGQAMTPEQAVEYALAEDDDAPVRH